MKIKLVLTGKPVGPRFAIVVNGQEVGLTNKSFLYLFYLVAGKILNPKNGGWINKYDIENTSNNHSRYLYRMASEIRAGLKGEYPQGWPPVHKSDHAGNYRLGGDVDLSFEWEFLEEFPDHDVREMVKRMKAKSAKGKKK